MKITTATARRYKLFGVDDLLIGAAISGLGSIFTNFTNKSNVEDTNAANRANVAATNQLSAEEAQRNRNFNAEEALKNRDFQERLSNSAYQRTMQDMARAGLNPILAYQKGGASTPSGATASGSQASFQSAKSEPFKMDNIATDTINTALSMRRSHQELENMREQQGAIHSQTRLNEAQKANTEAKTAIEIEDLEPAKQRAVQARIDRDVLQSTAGRAIRTAGTTAQETARITDPIVNTGAKIAGSILPWKSYGVPTEVTKSGSKWVDPKTGANHYQDTTFSNRFKGW